MLDLFMPNYDKLYIITDYITFPGDQNIYTCIVVSTPFFYKTGL